ncbi:MULTISPECIES: SA1362 family protein [unclassified Staphylococcus]|uniref:SA1362 family protein n=1 Tax=unclassified Staphylococcus TaxID=91994 RepID=UPI0021CF1E31|nr:MULTISPECIES: SA1362 family protein [unclassified Staphylococcus]UXR68685.1 hypothetical protein MUA26_05715 [Staphylococcus sp. IVB6246]UXR70742.1 hypothetical protein MUA88_05795 [Staphylococcus sp. IVB6240]UXR72973.1 hypothetical protein MUA48_05970 [Staphylococcus sp. IVB6238]UXR75268.1 hypothetical protein MUA74_06030 [Staphylococcus sp. IVB6233]UXR79469.1 hypothetical protein MUA65_05635 [Staphylococcus sp. IVB6218]
MSVFQKILFGFIALIAFIGLIMNLEAFLYSITNTLITMIVIIGVIYLVYFFFFLTEDQRKYKKAVWKNKWKYRKRR